MTNATIGNWSFKLGSAASPQVLTAIEEVTDLSGVGVSNALVEVTNWDSANSREFVAGLADGTEFTLSCNYLAAGNAAGQVAAIVAANAAATRLFEVKQTGVSPNETWTGSVVCLGYELAPSQDDGNSLTFTYKISGTLTKA